MFLKRYRDRIAPARPLTVGGQNVTFSYKTLPDNYTQANLTETYRLLANDSAVNFLLAPFGTSGTTWAAASTERANKVLMASTSASSVFNKNLRRTFSTYPPVSRCVSLGGQLY